MRNSLLLLALVPAAASAQTVTLSPVFGNYFGANSISGTASVGSSTSGIGMSTRSLYNPNLPGAEIGTGGTPYVSVSSWMVAFDLPVGPLDARLVSARLSTTVMGGGGRGLNVSPFALSSDSSDLSPYVSRFSLLRGAPFLLPGNTGPGAIVQTDAMSSARAGKRYVLFGMATNPTATMSQGWSTPTLILVYGPPVRVAVSLADFRGDATKVPVTVEFRKPGTTEVVSSATTYPDTSGMVEVGAAIGTYDVSIKASHWLRRTLPNVAVSAPSSLAATLVNGDVNGDNVVSATDRAFITAHLGESSYSSLALYNADLNGDGYITAADRAIVTASLGSIGDN